VAIVCAKILKVKQLSASEKNFCQDLDPGLDFDFANIICMA